MCKVCTDMHGARTWTVHGMCTVRARDVHGAWEVYSARDMHGARDVHNARDVHGARDVHSAKDVLSA